MANKKSPSPRQFKLLRFIWQYSHDSGRPPTIRQIDEAIEASSTGVVSYHVGRLEKQGYLEREHRAARGLKLTDRAIALLKEAGLSLQEEFSRVVGIPLEGYIQAGQPLEFNFHPEAEKDLVYVDTSLLSRKLAGLVALRVRGDSMIDAGVEEGDIVILEPIEATSEARNGQMVAAWLEEENEMTLKYFRHKAGDDKIQLKPANKLMEPIWVPVSNLRVQGRVVLIVHQPGRVH